MTSKEGLCSCGLCEVVFVSPSVQNHQQFSEWQSLTFDLPNCSNKPVIRKLLVSATTWTKPRERKAGIPHQGLEQPMWLLLIEDDQQSQQSA